jgi:hypothetical protein
MQRSFSFRTGLGGAFVVAAALSILGLAGLSAPARAAVEQNFGLATTADLVALCDVDSNDPDFIPAVQFCRGFGVGAYHYYLAIAANNPGDRYVCLPDPAPSRDTIRAAFVVWAKANQSEMAKPPVESLFRYLGETYPCSAAMRAGQ